MVTMLKRGWLAGIIFYFSVIHISNAEIDTSTFNQVFNKHQALVSQEKYQQALPLAKESYLQSKSLFQPLNSNRLIATDNYALNLQVTGNQLEARTVFIELVGLYEQKYGKHSKELLPILTDINALDEALGDKVEAEQAKATAIRKYKLYLRHHSDDFVKQFADAELPTTMHAKNTLGKVNSHLGNKYTIYESDHWSIIYPKKKLKFVQKHLADVMEKTYKNNLSFMISLGLRNKPIDDKMTAIYFANKADYRSYHKKSSLDGYKANKSGVSYNHKAQAIFLYDRGKNKKGKAKHASPELVVWASTIQVLHKAGLLSRNVVFPNWFKKGLASSFKAQSRNKSFGPHQDNYRLKNIILAKKMYESGTLATLNTLVSFDGDDEDYRAESRKNLFDISTQGSLLVRFLYLNYPDELIDYINIIKKSRTAKYERAKFGKNVRLKQFKKAFGEPDAMQEQYNAFLEQTFADAQVAYADYKKRKKAKKNKKNKLSD